MDQENEADGKNCKNRMYGLSAWGKLQMKLFKTPVVIYFFAKFVKKLLPLLFTAFANQR